MKSELKNQAKDKVKNTNVIYYESGKIIQGKSEKESYSEAGIFVITREVEHQNKHITVKQLHNRNLELIGIVDQNGNIIFEEEYKKSIKEKLGQTLENIDIDNLQMSIEKFEELNEGLGKPLTKEEINDIMDQDKVGNIIDKQGNTGEQDEKQEVENDQDQENKKVEQDMKKMEEEIGIKR